MAIDNEAKTSFCKRKKEEEGRKVREYGKEEGGEKRKGIFFLIGFAGFVGLFTLQHPLATRSLLVPHSLPRFVLPPRQLMT